MLPDNGFSEKFFMTDLQVYSYCFGNGLRGIMLFRH